MFKISNKLLFFKLTIQFKIITFDATTKVEELMFDYLLICQNNAIRLIY